MRDKATNYFWQLLILTDTHVHTHISKLCYMLIKYLIVENSDY